MSVLPDFFSITLSGLRALRPGSFFVSFVGAIVLAVLCFVFCTYYTRLWNKKYKVTSSYQILSVITSFFTFIFILTLIGFSNYRYIIEANINLWVLHLKADQNWKAGVMRQSYDKVKESGLEDFTNFQNPNGNVPASKPESQELVASIFSKEACINFKKAHSFLAKFAWTKSEIPSDVLRKDLGDYFAAHPNSSYSSDNAVDLVSRTIKSDLIAQIPRVVKEVRIILIIAFLILELIPFSLIGLAAYNDLKIQV